MSRLQQLKSSKLKEIFQKKRLELEEICRQSHMVTETLSAMEYSNEVLESGNFFSFVITLDISVYLSLRQILAMPSY